MPPAPRISPPTTFLLPNVIRTASLILIKEHSMKFVFSLAFILLTATLAFAQGGNESSPIVEKEIAYKDWNYKNVQTGAETSLRSFAAGKKLVMVVYFAPWCPNWKHDVKF